MDFLDGIHPKIRAVVLRGEGTEQVKDLVREAADIEDIVAVVRLHGRIGLDVKADQLCLRAALFDFVPFGEHRAVFAARHIRPRFVVGNHQQQIDRRFFAVQPCQRRAARGTAVRKRHITPTAEIRYKLQATCTNPIARSAPTT